METTVAASEDGHAGRASAQLVDGMAAGTTTNDTVRLSGEIDVCNIDLFCQFLAATAPRGLLLDLSGLSFIDVAGVSRLVDLSCTLGPLRRLLVASPPRSFRLIVDAIGWVEDFELAEADLRWPPRG